LNGHGAGHGVNRTGELDQHSVTGGLDDPAGVTRDRWIDDLAATGLQGSQRADLVGTHEPTVTGDIGRQHRRQSPLDAILVQSATPDRGNSRE
jgi:hypothetical protein